MAVPNTDDMDAFYDLAGFRVWLAENHAHRQVLWPRTERPISAGRLQAAPLAEIAAAKADRRGQDPNGTGK